ncbi:flavodoxin family protein [Cognatiluteimonas weifangensis]|nr:flavodoxin [Luteimonas weifangensis]
MARRTLIAYYSMTGNTRKIADELRTAMGADCEEIHEPRARRGVGGVLRAMVDTLARREPPIEPVQRDPLDYDLLVLGGPVWAGRIAAPMRTYAHRYGALAPEVAFFCTEGGRGAEGAFAELEEFCRHAPKATLVLDAEHMEASAHRDSLQRFAATAHPAAH